MPVSPPRFRVLLTRNPPRREERLFNLLLHHEAEVNFNRVASVLSGHRPLRLPPRRGVSQKPANPPQTATAGIAKAETIDNRLKRYNIAALILEAGASRGSRELSAGLLFLVPYTTSVGLPWAKSQASLSVLALVERNVLFLRKELAGWLIPAHLLKDIDSRSRLQS